MFTRITRAQLLAVTGWSSGDLDNRAHAGQLALGFGLALPAESGVYLGFDCVALKLSDALAEAGFTRALAGQFVRAHHEQWLRGISRLEWPKYYPPLEPITWGLTKTAIDEGITAPPPPDAEIYLGVAQATDGAFKVVCGTMTEAVARLAEMRAGPAYIRQTNLRLVYETTLAAAAKADVDLGTPFTRPEGHPEHREWYAAVEVHRALSAQRAKMRKPPGPARAKTRSKATKKRPARAMAT